MTIHKPASIEAGATPSITVAVWAGMRARSLYVYDGRQVVAVDAAPTRNAAQARLLAHAQRHGIFDAARFGHVELWWHSGLEPWRLSLQGCTAFWQIGEVIPNEA